ncbi:MAG: copper chaperone PCu(A)C [Proteobacteria bacterium]|nr:copper chaperone PCu(A)C [Pseudomonadota bacterium]MDA1332147.1 copper chaperone PCu(A)C [Pseudomonadota bacterium]
MFRYLGLFLCLYASVVFSGHHEPKEHPSEMHIMNAWVKEPLPGVDATGAYLFIHNHGKLADRLIGVSTAIAKLSEIHEMFHKNGVMKMRRLKSGISIAPDQKVQLKSGGLHIMLFHLNKPIKAGEAYILTLEFEKSGRVDVPVIVKKGADSKSHDQQHSH